MRERVVPREDAVPLRHARLPPAGPHPSGSSRARNPAGASLWRSSPIPSALPPTGGWGYRRGMSPLRPRTALATHLVENQPPERGDLDLWGGDRPLREAVARAGGAGHAEALAGLRPVRRIGGGAGRRAAGQPVSAGAAGVRPRRAADRRGGVPSGLPHADGDGGRGRLPVGRLDRAGRRARRARGDGLPAQPGRAGGLLPADHDLCRGAGAAGPTRAWRPNGSRGCWPGATTAPTARRARRPGPRSGWR